MTDWNPSAWGCNKSELKLVKRTPEGDPLARRAQDRQAQRVERPD